MSNNKRLMTHFIDKTAGQIIYNFVTLFVPKNKSVNYINNNSIKNVLFIKSGGLGDYLLNIPCFNEAKKTFPNAKFHLFCFNRNREFTTLYNKFDSITVIDKPINLIKFLFLKKKYDVVFDFDQTRKIPSIISILSKAKVRVGFDTNNRKKAYTHLICYKHKMYEAENFFNQLKYFTQNRFNYNMLLLKPKTSIKVNHILKRGRNVGIYAAAMKPENRLSLERWEKILQKEKKSNLYLLGGKSDVTFYDDFVKYFKDFNIVRTDGNLNLQESLYLISKLDKVYAEDGGAFHLAVCVGTPTESYWGPSIMEKWKPDLPIHVGIKSNLPCAPCTYGKFAEFKGCPYGNKCMKN